MSLARMAHQIIAFLVFGLLHSIGAQDPFKKALTRWTNQIFRRLFLASDLLWFELLGPLLRYRRAALGPKIPNMTSGCSIIRIGCG